MLSPWFLPSKSRPSGAYAANVPHTMHGTSRVQEMSRGRAPPKKVVRTPAHCHFLLALEHASCGRRGGGSTTRSPLDELETFNTECTSFLRSAWTKGFHMWCKKLALVEVLLPPSPLGPPWIPMGSMAWTSTARSVALLPPSPHGTPWLAARCSAVGIWRQSKLT